AAASGSGRWSLEELAVLDEAAALGEAVVEHAPLVVALLGQPVHPRGTGGGRLGVDVLDQRAADAAAALVRGDEQVLQVAVVAAGPAAAVEDEMHQTYGLLAAPGQGRVHRLGRVEEALPGQGTGLGGDLRLVEALVALPERQPGGLV